MRILLAVDGSPCSEAATEAVILQFSRENTEVRVLHADEWPRNLPLELSFAEGPTAATEILALHARRLADGETLVASTAGQLRAAGFRTSTVVAAADARHGIVDAATEWPADLIVLGSHGRKGMDRFLLGSVSDSVMRRAPCSVQIVRAR
jgi:nucleotide-binding universal stress UspA family protein